LRARSPKPSVDAQAASLPFAKSKCLIVVLVHCITRLTFAALMYSITSSRGPQPSAFDAPGHQTESNESIEPMDNDENISAHEKRRQIVHATNGDILVQVLGIPETGYECMRVNHSWPERGLIAGDIVLFEARNNAAEDDIVLIEDQGEMRLGIASTTGYLQTPRGPRAMEATERIIGVGVGLARKLGVRSQV
jgi:hypothetical protein